MPLVYQEPFCVFEFECDPWDRMTPGAILRRVQEIGTRQSEDFGLNEAHYKATHTVFLVSRISLEVYTAPVVGQQVRAETRAYGMHRAVYQRVTSLHDAATGKKLCEADSRWVLVNTDTRRILRKEPEGFISAFMDKPGAEEHSMQTPKPGKLASYGTHIATTMLSDRNGHLNNSSYADLVFDCLPTEILKQTPIKKMLLIYRAEIEMGKSFEMFGSPAGPDGKTLYFVAEEDNRKNFEAFVSF